MKTASHGEPIFHPADVLYALEWAVRTPGLVHWRVKLDSERQTRLVLVLPPGAHWPAFEISRNGDQVQVAGSAMTENGEPARYFSSLREAVLAICPMGEDQVVAANEAMEVLYPRARDRA